MQVQTLGGAMFTNIATAGAGSELSTTLEMLDKGIPDRRRKEAQWSAQVDRPPFLRLPAARG